MMLDTTKMRLVVENGLEVHLAVIDPDNRKPSITQVADSLRVVNRLRQLEAALILIEECAIELLQAQQAEEVG